MKIIKDGDPETAVVVFEKLCLCGCDFEFTASEIKWPICFNTEGNPNLFGTVD